MKWATCLEKSIFAWCLSLWKSQCLRSLRWLLFSIVFTCACPCVPVMDCFAFFSFGYHISVTERILSDSPFRILFPRFLLAVVGVALVHTFSLKWPEHKHATLSPHLTDGRLEYFLFLVLYILWLETSCQTFPQLINLKSHLNKIFFL